MKRKADFFTTTDQKKMYFEEIIFGNDRCYLVLLNGLTQSTVSWQWCLDHLKWNGRVVLCDLIFQGKSDQYGPSRDFNQHAKDVKELLEFLNAENICLSGISYGSIVAQHFAVNYAESLRKLILISTFAHKTPFYKAIEQSWKNALLTGGYELLLDVMLPYVLSEKYFMSPIIPIDTIKKLRLELQPRKESILKLMEATENRKDYLEELSWVKCQTLIIQGENDLLFPPYFAKAIQEKIRGSKLLIIPGKGHTLNIEAAAIISEEISLFCQ